MYSPIVIITLRCSTTTLLHLLIHKRESVPSTTHLALHRLHPLLLHPMLLLMTNELHTYGITIQCSYIWSRKLFNVMISQQQQQQLQKKSVWISDVRLLNIQSLIFELICSQCDKQRYYLDLAKSRGRIGSIAIQQCLYQLSILCK